jgi:hypothetical protein
MLIGKRGPYPGACSWVLHFLNCLLNFWLRFGIITERGEVLWVIASDLFPPPPPGPPEGFIAPAASHCLFSYPPLRITDNVCFSGRPFYSAGNSSSRRRASPERASNLTPPAELRPPFGGHSPVSTVGNSVLTGGNSAPVINRKRRT